MDTASVMSALSRPLWLSLQAYCTSIIKIPLLSGYAVFLLFPAFHQLCTSSHTAGIPWESILDDREGPMALPSLLNVYYFICIISQSVTRNVFSYKTQQENQSFHSTQELVIFLFVITQGTPALRVATRNLFVQRRMFEEPLKNSKCTEAKT